MGRVVPANAEYGKFFRKDKPDHYINTPLFYEAWKSLKADGRWAAMSWVVKVSSGSWSRLIHPSRPGAGGRTLRRAKRVGSTALGERTSSCRGPWTMPKSPRLATSP